MDQWAKDWLEAQRNRGGKCLEIKQCGENSILLHEEMLEMADY